MSEFLARLFDTSDFVPRRQCGHWSEELVRLHVSSDLAIWLAYMTIPAVLVLFVRRRHDVPFSWVFWMFGAFIVSCGFTHLMEVVVFSTPVYRLAGMIKLLTAAVSWATVAGLIHVLPRALSLRSAEDLEREVLERRRAEEALRQSEARLRAIVDNAGIGIGTVDLQGRIIESNPALRDLLGYDGEELRGRAFTEVTHAQDRDSDLILFRELMAGQRSAYQVEKRFLRKDGRVLRGRLTVSMVRDEARAPRFAIAMLEDVTARLQAKEALAVRARQQTAVAELGQEALAGTAAQALLDSAARLVGRALGVAYARVMEILPDRGDLLLRAGVGWRPGCVGSVTVPGGSGSQAGYALLTDAPVLVEDVRTEQRFGVAPLLREHDIVSSLSVPIRQASRAFGVLGADDAVRHSFGEDDVLFLRSMAHVLGLALERRQVEGRLRAANARLEQSNRELQEFASVASHDLQEPLRKIVGFADRLRAGFGEGLGETGREYLDEMASAASRMRALVNDLLGLAQVSTRAQPFVSVDLAGVAREVLLDLQARQEQSGGRVDVGELPAIDADPTQMRQLLQNLIGNALKFHRPEQPPVVRVRGEVVEEWPGGPALCRISVEDEGLGFDEKYLGRIFQPFQRLHGRSRFEGTGMGLAICRKIVERHGGTITARSAPGRGSIFVVTLPQRQTQEVMPRE